MRRPLRTWWCWRGAAPLVLGLVVGSACAIPFWRSERASCAATPGHAGAASAASTSLPGAAPDPGLGIAAADPAAAEPAAANVTVQNGGAGGSPSGPVVPAAPLSPDPVGAPPPSVLPPYVDALDEELAPGLEIEGVERLDYYFSRLALTDLGVPGAITRASQWGDSVIGGDGLTQAIRDRLQHRFGDAGHGFHALGKYSRWYGHRGIHYEERRSWETCLIIFRCQSDRRYGYGGVTSLSRGRSLSIWSTRGEDPGHDVSRFELWYQKRPDGGAFEIRVDGHVERRVDTRAALVSDEVETVQLPDAEHEIEVESLGTGVARGYGVVLERDHPGVVWDELSLIGSFIQRLDYEDPEHIAGQVRRRNVDLLVFMFGGNDLQRENTDLKVTTEPYEREYARVVRKFRAGKPEASCLLLAMTDHARRVDGMIVSRPGVARMVAAQRRIAAAEGCGFYDTYTAMGGSGAVERGRTSQPPLFSPDLHHPSLSGQRHIGTLLYGALMRGYAGYRRSHQGQVLPPAG